MINIGIEHEFVFKDHTGKYLDFDNTEYWLFQQIVESFPYIENDDKVFECKSLEDKPKRCYVEGFERYDENGKLVETIPKALEIRTLPYSTINAVIEEFSTSFSQAMQIAKSFGLSPLLTGWNPYKNSVKFKRPLSEIELSLRTEEQLAIAFNSMLVHGLQVNVSICNFSKQQMTDLAHKINYYVPFIIPFSFSSPFYNGGVFEGLSYRLYYKANTRKMVRLHRRNGIDVMEFEGFDACGDAQLLKSLLLLFKGLLLDKTLTKKAISQDIDLVKLSAMQGFSNEKIKQEAELVLNAAKAALEEESVGLKHLEAMLHTNDSYAIRMKHLYQKTGDIISAISDRYKY